MNSLKTLYLILLLSVVMLFGCKSSILDDPSTTIQFSIPERSHVKLTVENSYNTLIATLVDADEMAGGNYSRSFSANNLPEGIYYYTIEVRGLETNYYYKSDHVMLLVK